MKALPPAAEDVVLEGVVVEHNGVPLGNRGWFGWESKPWPHPVWPHKTSAHFVVDGEFIYDGQTGQKLN